MAGNCQQLFFCPFPLCSWSPALLSHTSAPSEQSPAASSGAQAECLQRMGTQVSAAFQEHPLLCLSFVSVSDVQVPLCHFLLIQQRKSLSGWSGCLVPSSPLPSDWFAVKRDVENPTGGLDGMEEISRGYPVPAPCPTSAPPLTISMRDIIISPGFVPQNHEMGQVGP